MAGVQAQQEALRLARIASSDHERLIGGASHQLLVALTHLPAVRNHDAPACSALFAALLKQYRIYANLGAIEPDGDVFCSALPLSGPLNLADRSYFRRAMETRDFAVGDFQIGRITGEATINFGYPVLGDTGQVQAVVFAVVEHNWLNWLAAEARLPQGSEMVVIDRNGIILARHPDPEKWVGRSASGMPIAKTVLARGEGVVEALDVDGISRLYGFTPCASTPHGPGMYVWIGIPGSVAYAEANRILARSLIGLGFAAALAIAAAWVYADRFILHRVRALVHGTERLTVGDLANRMEVTGGDEFSTLATRFNEMTDRLQDAYDQLAAHVRELEQRAQELSLFREIDRMILAETPLQDLLSKVVETFARLTGSTTCVLVTADQEAGELKPVAIWGPDQEVLRRYVATLKPRVGEEGGSLGRAIATREVVSISDIASDPSMEWYRDAVLTLGIRAVLSVPLLIDQQVLGAVGIGYPTARRFSEAEIRTMKGVASQLTVVLEQARLREEAKERWRLEEASRVKALFIANMSHELRTPLNSVIGFAELLRDGVYGVLNEKQRRYTGHIHESGKHLLALISDILDLSKVEAGKIELHPELLLVADALEASVALLHDQAAKKSLALELQIEEGLPQIMADPVRLKQILFNLLSNAVKFTPDGGRVTVTAKTAPGEFVDIAVADTGLGIKPEDLPRLFQEFVRLDTAIAQHAEGTGLGLALTKRLVELHGGTIAAVSEGEGRGSTFTVRLPLVPAPRD
ncbi:MAG: GAF domain-containing protein [candidate division NC10 bacterium]|nr:GAF domain-containing protein [candidate division NC10 bacterium]